jgi:hypothetical protein
MPLDILDFVSRRKPPRDGFLTGRRIIFADIDDAQGRLRRRCAHPHVGRVRTEAQFEFGRPRLALAELGFQRQPEAVN